MTLRNETFGREIAGQKFAHAARVAIIPKPGEDVFRYIRLYGGKVNRREIILGSICMHPLAKTFQELVNVSRASNPTNREVMWRRTNDNLSFEQARLTRTESEIDISGVILAAQNDLPLQVQYCITCDSTWATRTVQIEQNWAGRNRHIELHHDGRGRWYRNQQEDRLLAGCTDVDLGLSPSTNSLPINRLGLPIEESAKVTAAWVQFPGLEVKPAPQIYRRLASKHYQYQNIASGFAASLEVDEDNLPLKYGDLWLQVANGPATSGPDPLSFAKALVSTGPAPELGDAVKAFGWLVGGWAAKVTDYDPGGEVRQGDGEWWFSWVLEGRAIQDVWISPSRKRRIPNEDDTYRAGVANNRYGSTIRWFDRKLQQWRIVWVNPVSGALNLLAGSRKGDQIELLGTEDDHPIRWTFSNIRANSFTWRGEDLADRKWRLSAEFQLRRII
jgi:hypothetical protein